MMTQAQKYMELAAQLTPEQRQDSGYQAALYLLSYDDDLARRAKKYITTDGIHFANFRTALKKDAIYDNGSDKRHIVEIAYSLFSWKDSRVNAHEMAQLSYPWLELACTAMYLQAGQAELVSVNAGTDLVLDFSKAQHTAQSSQSIGAIPPMGRIHERDAVPQPLSPLENLCAGAKAQAAELNGRKAADTVMREPEQTKN